MSDSEPDEQELALKRVLGRYKSTKGDADKRKETSKLNMAKARAAKLSGLKAKKIEEDNQYELPMSDESEDDDESSDEEDLILKRRKPQKGRGGAPPAATSDRMQRMEEMIMQLALQRTKQNKKKKAPSRRTVIQLAPAAATAVAVSNPTAELLKRNILRF